MRDQIGFKVLPVHLISVQANTYFSSFEICILLLFMDLLQENNLITPMTKIYHFTEYP